MFTKRKDMKCVSLFENRDNITFHGKNASGLHNIYKFNILETNGTNIMITIIDKIGLHIAMDDDIIHYENKNMDKYKHAKKLLDYLVGNLNKWNL